MGNKGLKDTWLRGIYTGILANSAIIYFWFPLFFELSPREDYKMMLGGPCSLLIVLSTTVYGVVLSCKSSHYRGLKKLATILTLMPMLLLIIIIALLAAMGHRPAP